jgi:hypothetical protein
MTKTLTALAAAGTIAIATMAAPTSASAHCRGCGVAAGLLGGLAAGAIIGSAAAGAYAPYGYYAPGPYVAYGPQCFWTRQRVWDGYRWRLARVRVCD